MKKLLVISLLSLSAFSANAHADMLGDGAKVVGGGIGGCAGALVVGGTYVTFSKNIKSYDHAAKIMNRACPTGATIGAGAGYMMTGHEDVNEEVIEETPIETE